MKSKLNRILVAAVLVMATLFCWTVYAQNKQTPKVVWEYNIFTSLERDNPTQLAQLGSEGWELTSLRTDEQMVGNFRQTRIYYYLKRPKQTAK
jgi:hypothetical protein